MGSGSSSVWVDRVVAVAATLQDGREQVGSGYLVSGRLVLTAEHCSRDKVTGEPGGPAPGGPRQRWWRGESRRRGAGPRAGRGRAAAA